MQHESWPVAVGPRVDIPRIQVSPDLEPKFGRVGNIFGSTPFRYPPDEPQEPLGYFVIVQSNNASERSRITFHFGSGGVYWVCTCCLRNSLQNLRGSCPPNMSYGMISYLRSGKAGTYIASKYQERCFTKRRMASRLSSLVACFDRTSHKCFQNLDHPENLGFVKVKSLAELNGMTPVKDNRRGCKAGFLC